MHRILLGLMMLGAGCALRTGSGSLSASNMPVNEGFVPKTRMQERGCNWYALSFIPVGPQVTVDQLKQRMISGADAIVNLSLENENYMAGLVAVHCLTLSATPVSTGGSHAQ